MYSAVVENVAVTDCVPGFHATGVLLYMNIHPSVDLLSCSMAKLASQYPTRSTSLPEQKRKCKERLFVPTRHGGISPVDLEDTLVASYFGLSRRICHL